MNRKRVLCVGLISLDIVTTCERYPNEDEEMRATSQRWKSGGNACTNATVLTQLGIECEFLGSLSEGTEAEFVCKHLSDRGIYHEDCVRHSDCGTPTSVVTLSLASGSRTVLHARNNLPELNLSAFQKVNLAKYNWIHFEGRRNEGEIVKMIAIVDEFNSMRTAHDKIVVSEELEKRRQSLVPLLAKANVVFTSKDFARFCGYSTASEAVKAFHSKAQAGAIVICAWREEGADGIGPEGEVKHSDAYHPKEVIDTLGAGDTFVAGAIYSLIKHSSIEDTLNFACKLAGLKCGMQGNDGVGNLIKQEHSFAI